MYCHLVLGLRLGLLCVEPAFQCLCQLRPDKLVDKLCVVRVSFRVFVDRVRMIHDAQFWRVSIKKIASAAYTTATVWLHCLRHSRGSHAVASLRVIWALILGTILCDSNGGRTHTAWFVGLLHVSSVHAASGCLQPDTVPGSQLYMFCWGVAVAARKETKAGTTVDTGNPWWCVVIDERHGVFLCPSVRCPFCTFLHGHTHTCAQLDF